MSGVARATGEIDAVLFDFGGVVLSSPFEAFARHEAAYGLPPGFIRDLNATNPDTNAWARLERSELDIPGFVEVFESEARRAGHSIDALAVLGLLAGEVRPQMLEAIDRILAGGFRTALLTNNIIGSVEAADPAMASVLARFEVVVESSKVGVRKPDPRFYEIACEMLSLDPARAVFLDDLGVNLKPARSMGMHTIKVADPDEALSELEHVLGLPLRP